MTNTNETFIYPTGREELNALMKEAEYYKIEGLKLIDSTNNFGDSFILNRKLAQELFKLCEFLSTDNWSLIYRGSTHGFGAKDFHNQCDGKSKTLTIIKTTQSYIFGGYTSLQWDSISYWQLDPDSFIFSLVNKENTPIKIKHDSSSGNYSICCGATHGPV